MDSTFYEVFILSNQTLNTAIREISFISSEPFRQGNTESGLVQDITFTLNAPSCPYFYFTNMEKEEISFENYYNLYIPDEIESVSLAVAAPVPPNDYEMQVMVTDNGKVLQRRDIVVHVVEVHPCPRRPGN